jgi:hypothetical protein
VAGGALGIESYEPLALDPLVVDDLAWTLPTLRFPIDLSGGVDAFRHHRGELTRLGLRASFEKLEAYARPKLREALGRASQPPQIWPLEAGVGVGIVGDLGALAFDLIWAPSARDARWVIANARGTGSVRVALAHALRVAETLFAGVAERQARRTRTRRRGRGHRPTRARERRSLPEPAHRRGRPRRHDGWGAGARARSTHGHGRRRARAR